MTTTDTRERPPKTAPSLLTRLGRATGSGRFWIAVASGIVVLLFAALAILGISGRGGQALGPASTDQSGAKALVSVLRQQGIRVVTTTTLAATREAASADPDNTTVLAFDSGPYLTGAQWKRLAASSAETVVVQPDQTALDAIAPGVTQGTADLTGTLAPRCELPALAKVDRITGSGSRYTTTDRNAVRCLPAESGGGYGLVQLSRDGGTRTTTVVGASAALTNASIADDDNAAFALTLLGQRPTLIWYLPSIDDLPKGSGTLASLTPGWVTPSVALLAAAAIAAAFWRGRRLGPLVIENLPVVVRSTETMEGRARLYERGSNRRHALDQVRIGTIERLAGTLGLGLGAGVDDVVFRAADLLAVDPREIRHVLVDADPQDDRHLVALSDSLRDLEHAVARAVRPR